MDQTASQQRNDEADEMYLNGIDELQNTLDNILSSHEQLNQRAIDIVKIDLISASIIVTGISIQRLQLTLVLIAGIISSLYSVWACSQVYKPRRFRRGFGRQGAVDMDKAIQNNIDSEEHYREIFYAYIDSIEHAREQHQIEKSHFDNGLWASIAALLFYIAAAVAIVFDGFPVGLDMALLFLVPILTLWGRDKGEE